MPCNPRQNATAQRVKTVTGAATCLLRTVHAWWRTCPAYSDPHAVEDKLHISRGCPANESMAIPSTQTVNPYIHTLKGRDMYVCMVLQFWSPSRAQPHPAQHNTTTRIGGGHALLHHFAPPLPWCHVPRQHELLARVHDTAFRCRRPPPP